MTTKKASATGTRLFGTTHEGVEGKYDTGEWHFAINPEWEGQPELFWAGRSSELKFR